MSQSNVVDSESTHTHTKTYQDKYATSFFRYEFCGGAQRFFGKVGIQQHQGRTIKQKLVVFVFADLKWQSRSSLFDVFFQPFFPEIQICLVCFLALLLRNPSVVNCRSVGEQKKHNIALHKQVSLKCLNKLAVYLNIIIQFS